MRRVTALGIAVLVIGLFVVGVAGAGAKENYATQDFGSYGTCVGVEHFEDYSDVSSGIVGDVGPSDEVVASLSGAGGTFKDYKVTLGADHLAVFDWRITIAGKYNWLIVTPDGKKLAGGSYDVPPPPTEIPCDEKVLMQEFPDFVGGADAGAEPATGDQPAQNSDNSANSDVSEPVSGSEGPPGWALTVLVIGGIGAFVGLMIFLASLVFRRGEDDDDDDDDDGPRMPAHPL